MIKIRLLTISMVLFSTILCHAQEYIPNKNSIYLSYGTVIFSDQLSLAYERSLFSKNQFSTNIKAGYGRYIRNNADFETGAKIYEQYWSISGVQLIQFVEISLGIAYSQYTLASGFEPLPEVDYSAKKRAFEFYGNFGCRWKKDNFLFRLGIGNLELLYIGMGWNL